MPFSSPQGVTCGQYSSAGVKLDLSLAVLVQLHENVHDCGTGSWVHCGFPFRGCSPALADVLLCPLQFSAAWRGAFGVPGAVENDGLATRRRHLEKVHSRITAEVSGLSRSQLLGKVKNAIGHLPAPAGQQYAVAFRNLETPPRTIFVPCSKSSL